MLENQNSHKSCDTTTYQCKIASCAKLKPNKLTKSKLSPMLQNVYHIVRRCTRKSHKRTVHANILYEQKHLLPNTIISERRTVKLSQNSLVMVSARLKSFISEIPSGSCKVFKKFVVIVRA